MKLEVQFAVALRKELRLFLFGISDERLSKICLDTRPLILGFSGVLGRN